MKKIWLLSKIQLSAFFGINKLLHSGNKREKLKLFGYIVLFVFIAFSVGMNVASMACAFAFMGLTDYIPVSTMVIASALCFIVTFMRTNGMLFAFKDYDSVMSLPVTTFQVVASRVFVNYFTSLLFSAVIFIGGNAVYAVTEAPTALFYVYSAVLMFIIPLIPTCFAGIVGTLTAFISSKFKKKSLIQTVLTLILIVGIMFVSLSLPKFMAGLENEATAAEVSMQAEEVIRGTFDSYLPSLWFHNAVISFDLSSFALLILVSLVLFITFLYVVSAVYRGINSRLMSHATGGSYTFKGFGRSSPFTAFYKKDLKRFLSSTIFVTNMGISVLFVLAASVALIFVPLETIANFVSGEDMSGYDIVTPVCAVIPFVISLMLSMCVIACPLVSLEGKSVWILKSSPIKTGIALAAKKAVQLTLTVPTGLIAGIICIIVLPLTPVQMIFAVVTPLVFALMLSEIGLFFGVRTADFGWTNEVMVIKQSVGSLFSMLSGFVLCGAPVALTLIFPAFPVLPVATAAAFVITIVFFAINHNTLTVRERD